MNLYINQLKSNEVITSYNFARNSDSVFSEIITKDKFDLLDNKNKLFKIIETENQILYINSEFKVTENDVIFCNTYFVKDLFSKLKNINNLKNLKLITSQTDHSITNELFKLKPNCISQWYSINVNFSSPDLIPIPLGLSNENEKNLNIKHFSKLKENKNKIDKIYVNFQSNTNYLKRSKQLKRFKNKSFVHVDEPNLKLDDYAEQLNSYKFILCPEGNGIDTHRVWESLILKTIPVVKRSDFIENLMKFGIPMLIVEEWEELYEINEDDLSIFYKKYAKQLIENDYLKLEFWIDLINQSKV